MYLKKSIKVFSYILFVLLLVIFSLSIYIKMNFDKVTFEQLFLNFIALDGVSVISNKDGIIFTLGCTFVLVCLFLIVPSIVFWMLKIYFVNKKNKCKLLEKISKCFYIIITIIFVVISLYNYGVIEYIKNIFNKSTLFEEYYIDPRSVNITFTENKRNLIYIYLESMESSFIDGKYNNVKTSYIPELEKIAKDNVSFSNTSDVGGAFALLNTTWTVSGLVAQTAGIPSLIGANTYKGYSTFLPGAYSIGEILEENGYKNYIMMGSDISFSGRDEYFSQHGNYTFYDYNYAKDTGLIDKDYHEWWGYEDRKLYEFAKTKLLEISSSGEKFNFTILTADSHFQDGYLDVTCKKEYNNQYANVVACASKMVNDFVNWIKKQSFYEDTVIVIVGDHLTMQYGDYINMINEDRKVYNVFINTDKSFDNTKNRLFSTMDLYPTTLAAIGANIEGERLGLGTNLFSGKETLIEKLGVDYINSEILKTSDYYNYNILKSTYYEMIEKK